VGVRGRVPRPKERSTTVIRSFALEKSLVDKLEEEAHKRRMSVSKLVEMILLQALNMEAGGEDPPNQTRAGDPSSIDPVIRADIEDFEEELSKLESTLTNIEGEVARNPYLIKPITNPLLDSIKQNLLSRISGVEEKLMKLRSKYYSLKRVAKNNGNLDKLATKMYDLKKRIKDIRKQLGGITRK
jgi:chromosome segregation ATPase